MGFGFNCCCVRMSLYQNNINIDKERKIPIGDYQHGCYNQCDSICVRSTGRCRHHQDWGEPSDKLLNQLLWDLSDEWMKCSSGRHRLAHNVLYFMNKLSKSILEAPVALGIDHADEW